MEPAPSPILSKSRLAIALSKLMVFETPDPSSEQYPTDSEIAAEILWDAHLKGDIEGKTVADLGCGTGILGIGALLLGAKMVYFIDQDASALQTLRENLKQLGLDKPGSPGQQTLNTTSQTYAILHQDVNDFQQKVDTVIQNPPFGTHLHKHADKIFLEKAFSIAKTIYSFHKSTSKEFLSAISNDHGFKIVEYYEFAFPLKASQFFHKKKLHRIKVGCWRLVKMLAWRFFD